MNPLGVSPLPSTRTEDETGSFLLERDGFVDEDVVTALVSAPHHPVRATGYHEDLALSADDMDFAGWRLSKETTPRRPEVPPQVIEAILRRAAPPAIREPGIGVSHTGSHRWWLAGLAGVLSTMLFSLLLLSLSTRSESVLSPQTLSPATPLPVKQAQPAKATPELTEISPAQR
jgi:hypothetical protein